MANVVKREMSTTGLRRPRTVGRANSNWSKSLAITTVLREEELSPTTISTASNSSSSDSDDKPQHKQYGYQQRLQQNRLGITPDTFPSPVATVSPISQDDDESEIGSTISNADAAYRMPHNSMKIGASDSSVVTSPVCNGAKHLGATTKHVGTPRTDIGKKSGADWAIPKWKQLESKRLALCQQRVQLERRLYEFSGNFSQNNSMHSHVGKWAEDDTITNLSRSSVSSTTSQSSTKSDFIDRNQIVDGMRRDDVDEFTIGSEPIILERFQLREDQDPVLWSGPVSRRNQPEGEGRMVFSDGQIYEGHVKAGQREGKGVNVWPNGQVYTGSWSQNSRSGRGTHRWPDGRTVTGPWLNGHLHGRVFFTWPDGATYDGDTVKGQKEGRGIHTWKDGRVYSGQYKNGAENGFGTLTERSQKTKYRGQFKDGKRDGLGMQIWKNKNYDGEWKRNVIHGRGKLTWLSGACYIGDFIDGRYNGTGTYRSESGTKYTGYWVDGYKHGQGTQTWPDGRVYNGHFVKNRRHGYGQMTFPDGTVYRGGWDNGKRAGYGIEVIVVIDEVSGEFTKAIKHCGMWKHNEAVVDERKNVNTTGGEDGNHRRTVDESMDDLQLVLKPTRSYAKSNHVDRNPVAVLHRNVFESRTIGDKNTESVEHCKSHLIFC